MKNFNLNIRISVDLKDGFYSKCKENMQTPSIVIRELLKLYIENGNELFKK